MKNDVENKNELYHEIIVEKEPEANVLIAKFQFAFGFVFLAAFLLFLLGFYRGNQILANVTLLGASFILFVISSLVLVLQGKGRALKYIILLSEELIVLLLALLTGYKLQIAYLIPILLSCRYFNPKLTITISVEAIVLLLVGAICNAYVSPKFGMMDLNMVVYSNPVTLSVDNWLYSPAIQAGIESNRVFWNTFRLTFLTNGTTIVFFTVIAVFVIRHVQNIMVEVKKETMEKDRLEQEVYNTNSKIMMSQIGPHFLYNTLTAIMAIDGNPDETVYALEDFGKYLRENINILTGSNLIPFEDEINHVHRYVNLEKLRFKDRVNVFWNLEKRNFKVPPLAIQMLVENAIKHGITQKVEGGTVRISSFVERESVYIVIEDDGVGFVENKAIAKTGHIGLENVRVRVAELCKGQTIIQSEIGVGTKVTLILPLEEENDEASNS